MHYNIRYVIIMISFLLSACGTSQSKIDDKKSEDNVLPSWINNHKDKYPDLLYISSMGISEYKTMSEKQAYQGIASAFELDIISTQDSKEVTNETSDKFTQTYSEVFNINTSTNQNLINIKTSETYFDKKSGKYYVLATLNKSETSAIYQEKRNKLLDDASDIYSKSKIEKDNLLKIAFISNSISKLDEVNEIEEKLKILDNSSMKVDKFEDIHNLVIEREKLLEKAEVYIINSDNKIYNMLKSDFTNLGFKMATNKNKALIIVDFNLRIDDSKVINQDAKFVMWNLDVNLNHNNKKHIFGSYSADGRSSQLSISAAKERAYFDINKKLDKEFTPFIISKILRIKK